MEELVEKYRENLIEKAAEQDEEVLEAYLETGVFGSKKCRIWLVLRWILLVTWLMSMVGRSMAFAASKWGIRP